MKCPHCADKTLSMTERQGIEIDYCPECRGIWLDRGELDKLLEKVRTEALETAPKELSRERIQEVIYKNDSYKGDYYKHKKKKSFLEELFD